MYLIYFYVKEGLGNIILHFKSLYPNTAIELGTLKNTNMDLRSFLWISDNPCKHLDSSA
jgi:hypothetical protein